MDKLSNLLPCLKSIFINFYLFKDGNGIPIPETLHFFVDGGTEGFNG
jgi:hypothetical protein